MGDVAIVYATTHGQTRTIVERLAERIAAAGHDVVQVDVTGAPSTPMPVVDRVVVAGAVYSNQHHHDLVVWLTTHADALAAVDTALVSVSLAAALETDDGEAMCWDYVGELAELTGFEANQTAVVAGALNESAYDPATKALLRVASWRAGLAASGDESFTDWDALDAQVDRWFG